MNIDFRSIAIYLYRKGRKPQEIQMKINSVFGEKSYSYQAITKSIRETSFTSSQHSIPKNDENYVHQQRIEIIKKILEGKTLDMF